MKKAPSQREKEILELKKMYQEYKEGRGPHGRPIMPVDPDMLGAGQPLDDEERMMMRRERMRAMGPEERMMMKQ